MPRGERFDDLLDRHFGEGLDPTEAAELDALLRRDPESRRRLRERARHEAALGEVLRRPAPQFSPPLEGPGSWRRFGPFLLAAAALVIAFVIYQRIDDRNDGSGSGAGSGSPWFVAETSGEALRTAPSDLWLTGQPDAAFDLDGTRVTLLKATRLRWSAAPVSGERPSLELAAGAVRIATSEGAPGVSIQTPAGRFQDRGTEFTLHLGSLEEGASMTSPKKLTLASTLVTLVVMTGLVDFTPKDLVDATITVAPGDGPVTFDPEGALARVADREGLVWRRARGSQRWTLVSARTRLFPGDWIRTGIRGAHAAKLRLANETILVLGPGARLEFGGLTQISLQRGELGVRPGKDVTLTVSGPGSRRQELAERATLRATDDALVKLEAEPRWLVSYEKDRVSDAMGSLLANIDGREVSLTMGYHKVSVDINDRVARTVVETSFKNQTSPHRTLEGVFYFPLPADASISSFAMWVGSEKVQGEIVEKARARQIYETLLREKKDPGLLEWSGGNLFKARVYPIDHTKRIQITYTQVIDRRGDDWRYVYPLASDLTRTTPLEQLEIDVRIHDAETLAGVRTPGYSVRQDLTDHAARVELSLDEFTPRRDFEVVVSTKPDAAEDTSPKLLLLPHRRGDDGYFLLRARLPRGPVEDAAREEALDLLVVADTSGSLSGTARNAQLEVLEALLGSLGATDRFDVLTVDTEVRALFGELRATDEAARRAGLSHVARREPLGWSDLEAGMRAAFARASQKTRIVYLGDGIVSAGDPDGAALIQRLRAAYGGRGQVHAISTGSTFDTTVLRGLAGFTDGSHRQAGSGGEEAVAAVRDLFEEMTRPSLSDITFDFEGIDVAAVHPSPFPRLSRGRELILAGRYDALGRPKTAAVTLRGRLGEREVTARTEVTIANRPEENAFVPRLWARRHLDHLLTQGSSPEMKQRIIGLSEDFQIITPYTSFLVLDSEEDRDRFKVERRFRMRDGEEFFARGRAEAEFALSRKALLAAGQWLHTLRAGIYKDLRGLGTETMESLAARVGWIAEGFVSRLGITGGSWGYGYTGPAGGGGGARYGLDKRAIGRSRGAPLAPGAARRESERALDAGVVDHFELGEDLQQGDAGRFYDEVAEEGAFDEDILPDLEVAESRNFRLPRERGRRAQRPNATLALPSKKRGFYQERIVAPETSALTQGLFPPRHGVPMTEIASSWPEELRTLAGSLDLRPWIRSLEGGVRITGGTVSTDARGVATRAEGGQWISGPTGWWRRDATVSGDAARQLWVWKGRQVVVDETWMLGRERPAKPGDLRDLHGPLGDSFSDLSRHFSAYLPTLETVAGERKRLRLRPRIPGPEAWEIDIDTARRVLLELRRYWDGELLSTVTHGDFVELDGRTLPTSSVSVDARSSRRIEVRVTIERLDETAFTAAMDQAVAGTEGALLLGELFPDPLEALQALRESKDSFRAHWTLLEHHAAHQRWSKMAPHAAALLELAANHPSKDRLEISFSRARRAGESVRRQLLAAARILAATARAGERSAAVDLVSQASQLHANERLALLEQLRPVYARSERPQPLHAHDRAILACLEQLRWYRRTHAHLEAMVERYPGDSTTQIRLVRSIAQGGDHAAAVARLRRLIQEGGKWSQIEDVGLRRTAIDLLANRGRHGDAVEWIEAWRRERPEGLPREMLNRWLSYLVMDARPERRNELTARWLEEGRAPTADRRARRRGRAALTHAIGQGSELTSRRLDPRWHDSVHATVKALANDSRRYLEVMRVLEQIDYNQSPEGLDFLRGLLARLSDESSSWHTHQAASLASRLVRYGNSLDMGYKERTAAARALLALWKRRGEDDDGDAVLGVLRQQTEEKLLVEYWRHRLVVAATSDVADRARRELFEQLLAQGGEDGNEAALFELLPKLRPVGPVPVDEVEVRRREAIAYGLHLLSRRLPRVLADAALKKVEGFAEVTRREKAKRIKSMRKETRRRLAGRLATLAADFPEAGLRPWLTLESLTLRTKAGDETAALAEAGFGLFPGMATRPRPLRDGSPLDELLAHRDLTLLAYLGVFRRDTDAHFARVLEHLGARVEAAARREGGIDPRPWIWRLLLARRRAPEAIAKLAEFYDEGKDARNARFGRYLAWLAAEQKDLARARKLFDDLEKDGILEAADYEQLAVWRKIEGSLDGELAAIRAAFDARPTNEIRNWLQRQLPRFQARNNHVPEDLDPRVPPAFLSALARDERPRNLVWLLDRYFDATKDFRLLACFAEGIVGQSAQQVHPYLQNISRQLGEMDDEATLDRLVARIDALRTQVTELTDRRALDLLEVTARIRGLDQGHGTADHLVGVLEALKSTGDRDWADGEPTLMARTLEVLPKARDARVVRTIRQVFADLQSRCSSGTTERFTVSWSRVRFLRNNGLKERSLELAETAMQDLRSGNDGCVPHALRSHLTQYTNYLRADGRWLDAERLWDKELALEQGEERRRWTENSLIRHWRNAIHKSAPSRLGQGPALVRAVQRELQAALRRDVSARHLDDLMDHVGEVWLLGQKHQDMSECLEAYREFTRTQIPALLARMKYDRYSSVLNDAAAGLRNLGDPEGGVDFLVTRAENEPEWLRIGHRHLWRSSGYRFARLVREARPLSDALAARLTTIILEELRYELVVPSGSVGQMPDRRNYAAWMRPLERYAEVATEVGDARLDDEFRQRRIAEYLARGLGKQSLAIERLLAAHGRRPLQLTGQILLVDILLEARRYEPAQPFITRIVDAWPDEFGYRQRWLKVAGGVKDEALIAKVITETDAHFTKKRLWNANALAAFGETCREIRRPEESVAFLERAVARHLRDRGSRRGQPLSTWYESLARAYSDRGETAKAVDAAAGAVVTWYPGSKQRTRALGRLRSILRRAKDLDTWIAAFEKEVASSGQENPLLREVLGDVLLRKRRAEDAIRHLEAAAASRPENLETWKLLVDAYDAAKKPKQADARLLTAARTAKLGNDLYARLGDRYARRGQAAEAERAWTQVVEDRPLEAEGHCTLAQIRRTQKDHEAEAREWALAAKLKAEDPMPRVEEALALSKLGRLEEAKQKLRAVLAGKWDDAYAAALGEARALLRRLE